MVDKSSKLLNNIPSKTSTNKSIQKITEKIEEDNGLKKCVTASVSLGKEVGNSKKSLFQRINTFQKTKSSDMQILKFMSENIYSVEKKEVDEDNDSELTEDEVESEEIKVAHRRIKVKTKTIKKISNLVFKKKKSDKSVNELEGSNQEDEITELSTKITKLQKIEEDDEIDEDNILQNLISRHYLDISDNLPGNFEDYVINNLTIISFLEKMMSKHQKPPTLNQENLKAIEKFDRKKKILFLDLDETLIHSDFSNKFEYWDAQIQIEVEEGSTAKLNILIRPYLTEFLEFVSKKFNVVLFTAGLESYAEAIIQYIDPMDEYFHLKLFRDSCLEFKNFFIKDLSILSTFGLKDMIIVDNCVFSFARNLKNGILVTSYYNDTNDEELLNLMTYLENNLIDVKDVRDINEGFYGLEAIRTFLYDKLKNEGVLK